MESTCNARFSDDGRKILYSGSGDITIKYRYRDKPNVSGLAVTDIEAGSQGDRGLHSSPIFAIFFM